MLLHARTAAASSSSFFHHLQASRCGSIRSALSPKLEAYRTETPLLGIICADNRYEETSLICSVKDILSSCRVRPLKRFCWQGHRGRIDSSCIAQHNGNVALPGGQMEAQTLPKALSQIELLMQQGSRMTAVAQVTYPSLICISSLL